MDQLSAALPSAEGGIRSADVARTPSSAGSLTVTVTVTADGLDPAGREVRTDTLERILEVTADNAADMRVTTLHLYADDEEGSDVSFTDAAADLRLQKSLNGDSLTLVAEEWTSFAEG
ncbi:hypothetical protein ACIPVB_12695 [Microbacterium sp. NPDC090007]|uniref:hypothetical protein n=1 Tax=Microbacterium sp. NPDC090007 TaxID=3364204 RepID=UPI0037F8DBE3